MRLCVVLAALVALAVARGAAAYYAATNVTTSDVGLVATLVLRSGFYPEFGPDITPLRLEVAYESDTHLRVKIVDPNSQRWEVPDVLLDSRVRAHDAKARNYRFDYQADPFEFKVVRLSDGEVIFDTGIFERLIYKDQYLEISTRLPLNANIYGLGERVHDMRLDNNYRVYAIYAADLGGVPVDANIYSSEPFYMETRSGRRSHGVFMLNSNGMDIDLRPDSLTYKIIGGVLDMFFFVGPTPAEVVQQYTSVIGRSYFPPYWVLGFHQCKWGYDTLAEVKEVVNQYRLNNIPLDTMWTDIDYMDRFLDWTFDPVKFPRDEVIAFADELERNGQHYMLIIDPAIHDLDASYTPYYNGLAKNVYVRTADGRAPYRGVVWPGSTVFPDFYHPNTSEWWYEETAKWMSGLKLGGLWIDMNEPANFVYNDDDVKASEGGSGLAPNYANPPYAINNHNQRAPLRRKTIDADTQHYNTVHYNVHNLYGHTEAIATRAALDRILGKRSLLLSRSNFAGSARYGGHWLGDNASQWADLFYSIPGMLTFAMFGTSLTGSDICGFFGDTSEELCARWMSLGAFYPFSRNHNALGQIPQEAYRFPAAAEAARRALATRYRILPYLYTLFYRASQFGDTVARPMFFEFDPESDADLLYFDRQFLLGPGVLVSPVLTQGATSVSAFFPRSTRWYSIADGREQASGWQTLSVPVSDIAVHVRGGVVVPMQDAALTTTAARLTPFSVVVALDKNGAAAGELFVDDGESFSTVESGRYLRVLYSATKTGAVAGTVSATVALAGYTPSAQLGTVTVWGVPAGVTSVRFNGSTRAFSVSGTTLTVAGLGAAMTANWSLEWQ